MALTFDTRVEGQNVIVTAILMHRSGHRQSTSIELPRDTSGSKNNVQAVGSSQTYGQRYAAQAILGLSLGDDTEDDGAASGRPHADAPNTSPRTASWAQTITQDMPETATPREKAEAIAAAICSQWKRMKGLRQIDNEWDRRAALISELEAKHKDLWGQVIQGYEEHRHQLDEQRAEKERGQ